MAEKGKFLWTVDAMADDPATQLTTLRALAKIADAVDASIEPVCVLTSAASKDAKTEQDRFRKEYRLEAEGRLDKWLKKIKSPALLPPVILVADGITVRSCVDRLLSYARETKAGLIGVGTATRKGLERFFVGSFSESLLLASDVPLLVVNVKAPATASPKRALFATDLSDASRSAFGTFLDQARRLGSKVVLYTKAEWAAPAGGALGMGLSLSLADSLKLDADQRRRTAQAWVDQAKAAGVDAKLVVDTKVGTTSDTMLKTAAREKVGLVALAARSGPIAATMLGSVARNVVRRSTVPVWVIHPRTGR